MSTAPVHPGVANAILNRFRAGESVDALADDYSFSPSQVEHAVCEALRALPPSIPAQLPPAAMREAFAAALDVVLGRYRALLLAKMNAYGDAVLDPVRVFSSADRVEQLRVRIDDKISRIVRGKAAGEDARVDLCGYLLLWDAVEEMGEGR